MDKITLFHQKYCPYCRQALQWIRELQQEHPELSGIEIELIDENREPDLADQFDYWYVPTCYIRGRKVHEGAASKAIMESVLRQAIAGQD